MRRMKRNIYSSLPFHCCPFGIGCPCSKRMSWVRAYTCVYAWLRIYLCLKQCRSKQACIVQCRTPTPAYKHRIHYTHTHTHSSSVRFDLKSMFTLVHSARTHANLDRLERLCLRVPFMCICAALLQCTWILVMKFSIGLYTRPTRSTQCRQIIHRLAVYMSVEKKNTTKNSNIHIRHSLTHTHLITINLLLFLFFFSFRYF